VSEFDCSEVNNCDDNAECVYNYEAGHYQCECNDGFSGDGLSCMDTGGGKIYLTYG
jgi:nidogen (entactin)